MNIDGFFSAQLEAWPAAAAAYRNLEQVLVRTIDVDGAEVRLQCNPARAVSTDAKVDSASIAARRCFLCSDARPAEQMSLAVLDGKYELLVNPYPIFNPHFVIAERKHLPQQIADRLADMVSLAERMPGFSLFYNGAKCGASAPDHQHFQAVHSDELPVWKNIYDADAVVPGNPIRIAAPCAQTLLKDMEDALGMLPGDPEPDVNIFVRADGGCYKGVIYPRRAHRPSCYFAEGDERVAVSPGAIDMAGVIVTPREEDFAKLDAGMVKKIYQEVSMPPQRTVDVGIMTVPSVEVSFHGEFFGIDPAEDKKVRYDASAISSELRIAPMFDNAEFSIGGVTIGVGFHWQREEEQRFRGELLLKPAAEGTIAVVNRIGVEDYLASVISSEMNAGSHIEFLSAHAIISRSWLMAQIEPRMPWPGEMTESDDVTIKWYDHDDHTLFDVCADDHCQRYQGVGRISGTKAHRAVGMTRGLVLTDGDGSLVDARFSKCCGGATEEFSTCWQDVRLPYLQAFTDDIPARLLPDLCCESEAVKWIYGRPDAFCARASDEIKATVLNGYDREIPDLYRWEVTYDADELASIILEKSGIDYGELLELKPLHRGPSGRIDRLLIRGTKRSRVIGKELEIRRTLSRTHLYSSAFVAKPEYEGDSHVPARWILKGAGWGHGVGLCQIGAAVMATEGYDHKAILNHYFPGTKLAEL